ncbi:cilia- and flagella-associated protein 57-like [Tachypleus tridentatus]|uniref:cilia- and flagella-associated protein 57-like n=1 Tax=Tachypleus tridentatus TaxID=6853 RepID=UPI003FD60B8A
MTNWLISEKFPPVINLSIEESKGFVKTVLGNNLPMEIQLTEESRISEETPSKGSPRIESQVDFSTIYLERAPTVTRQEVAKESTMYTIFVPFDLSVHFTTNTDINETILDGYDRIYAIQVSACQRGPPHVHLHDDIELLKKKKKKKTLTLPKLRITLLLSTYWVNKIQELKHEVEHLQLENEYQLRLRDMNHSLRMKEIIDKHKQEIDDLKVKIRAIEKEMKKREDDNSEEVERIQEKHVEEMLNQETCYKQKLLLEYERYKELQKKSQLMQDSYEQQIREMETTHQKAVQEMIDEYEQRLTERETQLEQAKEEAQLKKQEEEELRRLIEEEADNETVQLRTNYEKQLKQEKENNIQLLGDNSILKKKLVRLVVQHVTWKLFTGMSCT